MDPGIGPDGAQLFPVLPANQVPVEGLPCAASRQASPAMRASAPHPLLRSSLVLLVLADLLLLASFVFNQWFEVSTMRAWGLAALLAMPLTMLAMPLVDAVLASLESGADDGFSGDKIPGAGQ